MSEKNREISHKKKKSEKEWKKRWNWKKRKKEKKVSLAKVGELGGQCLKKKKHLCTHVGFLVRNSNNLALASVLLHEFEDVFQDVVPKELPPIIGIENKIDYINALNI